MDNGQSRHVRTFHEMDLASAADLYLRAFGDLLNQKESGKR
jgi:hypothetical protein